LQQNVYILQVRFLQVAYRAFPPIKPVRGEAEKVQIAIQGGDDPNQKIRIANILIGARGEAVSLKTGAVVQIIVKPKPKDPIE
jgi:hypothetical protein